MVKIPTRPKYIYTVISSCAGRLSAEVTPVVNPTVARADTASYSPSVKEMGDVMQMTYL